MVLAIKILTLICLVCLVPFCAGLGRFGIDIIKGYLSPDDNDEKP